MRYLGIDYGTKRIGIALSDEEGSFAFPKEIISSDKEAIEIIKKYIQEEQAGGIVVGESQASNDTPNEIAPIIERFKKELETLGIPVYFEREGYSSVEAYRYQTAKGPADDRAAAIILQRFLDKNKKTI